MVDKQLEKLKDFYIKVLKFDIDSFDESIRNNDIESSFMHFFHFLEDLFALREKLNYENKFSKTMFGLFYQYYNAIKHQKMDINIFKIFYPQYAMSFPIELGVNSGFSLKECYFTDVHELEISDANGKHPEKNIYIIDFYDIFNKELANKPVNFIMKKIYEDAQSYSKQEQRK